MTVTAEHLRLRRTATGYQLAANPGLLIDRPTTAKQTARHAIALINHRSSR